MIEMFTYDFIIRALISGVLISLCSSILGVSLVLRKKSMIGDGLSHVAFGAFAVATALNVTPIYFALPITIICSFFILKLGENNKINGDSAIALFSASALAIGISFISITKGVNNDINSYLFGSILSVSIADVILCIVLTIIVITLFILFYNKIFAITFDEKFAKSTGINTGIYNIILSVLCSIIVVFGMRMMGSLLISSLIIFPCLSSMEIFRKFKSVIISSGVISVVCFVIGLTLSYLYEFPTGSIIVIVNLCVLILMKFLSFIKEDLWK